MVTSDRAGPPLRPSAAGLLEVVLSLSSSAWLALVLGHGVYLMYVNDFKAQVPCRFPPRADNKFLHLICPVNIPVYRDTDYRLTALIARDAR